MDWLPWRIACNFIRAFCPTLIVLISWDLWSNLSYAGRARPIAVTTDLIAMVVVLSIRLTPSLRQARKQLRHLVRFSWMGLGSLCASLLLLVFHKPSSVNLRDVLLLVAAYALYTDISRVCKISLSDSERGIQFVYIFLGVVGYSVLGTVSFVRTLSQDTIHLKGALSDAASLLMLVALLFVVGRWGQRRQPAPVIQELGLNR